MIQPLRLLPQLSLYQWEVDKLFKHQEEVSSPNSVSGLSKEAMVNSSGKYPGEGREAHSGTYTMAREGNP